MKNGPLGEAHSIRPAFCGIFEMSAGLTEKYLSPGIPPREDGVLIMSGRRLDRVGIYGCDHKTGSGAEL